ncbi:MAG: hypothetical protein WC383_13300 [Gammaproteobacteria bacterium]
MVNGMHLTDIGGGDMLLEPGEGLDPTDPDAYLAPLLHCLQERRAQRLFYDLKELPLIDEPYYDWLLTLHANCRLIGVELIAVNMQAPAAFALALQLKALPPFVCAQDVERARRRAEVS